MTLEQYVSFLEKEVDPQFVELVQHWPIDTKLYVYLHNIQLVRMEEFKQLLADAV